MYLAERKGRVLLWGESMITSFDGTKLYLKKETAADNKAVIVIVHGLCEHQQGTIILRKNFMRRESEPIVLIDRGHRRSEGEETFIQISMNFWTTPT